MIRYSVRSRYLVDVVNDIKTGKYILAPYFQRKLVWRDAHKVDFIETILLRFPFPEIFLARGDIDVEKMTSTSCVVDGQQRLSTIREFVDSKFPVKGLRYVDLSPETKELFLKYEIAIIELDLPHNSPEIIEIFKRLNRTFYALSAIEKQATEFASSEFMMIAKFLCGELRFEDEDILNMDEEQEPARFDPNVTPEFIEWAKAQKISNFKSLIVDSSVFSKFEVSRMVHLSFTLNIIATVIRGYYNRNQGVNDCLEDSSCEQSIHARGLVTGLEDTAKLIKRAKVLSSKFWFTKSNLFTLFVALYKIRNRFSTLDIAKLTDNLKKFEIRVPDDYALAAREAVNNKQERILRDRYVATLIDQSIPAE